MATLIHRTILATIVASLIGNKALARPNWISTPPDEDQEYKYYVGRSEPADTEGEAFRMAARNAYEEALRENYGVALEVSTSTFESESSLEIVRHLNESSKKVIIENFKQVDSHREILDGGQIVVWILYKYSKVAISNEKTRLSAEPQNSSQYSMVGGDEIAFATDIFISSRPSGAEVFIDEIRWGRTPVRLKGALPPGTYNLNLSHPQYAELRQKIIVPNEKSLTLEKNLLPAQGHIIVNTTPAGAKITIDNVFVGLSPTTQYRVAAGKLLSIIASHPDAEEVHQRITIEKDTLREIEINLILKPSFLKITKLCATCTVTLDQVTLTSAQLLTKLSIDQGGHTVIVQKPGCDPVVEQISAKPGETLSYIAPEPRPTLIPPRQPETIDSNQSDFSRKLNRGNDNRYWYSSELFEPTSPPSQPFQSATMVTFGCSFNSQVTDSTGDAGHFGFVFGLEKRFLRYFGIRGSISYDMGSMYVENPEPFYASSTYDFNGFSRQIGGVVYLGDSPSTLFLSYEVGSHQRSFSGDSPIPSFSVDRSIITIGISDFKYNASVSISLYSNILPKGGRHDSAGFNILFFGY